MAVYWCTEALPLSVTALLPIVLFPFLGILPSSKVCPQYFLDTNFLFLSGLIMATAIEEWNLHRRIALKVLMLVGVQPARLILGMMVTTSFLSMWLSNTASTAMMLPIANAILKSLFGQKEAQKELSWEGDENTAAVRRSGLPAVPTEMRFLASTEEGHPDEVEAPLDLPADSKKEEEYRRNIWKGFLISIPYSASIGGTATLTGTAPNLILLGQLKRPSSHLSGSDPDELLCSVDLSVSTGPLNISLGLMFSDRQPDSGATAGSARQAGDGKSGTQRAAAPPHSLCFRGWRKRKSKLRVDAEEKARAVIREEFQNLGPIKFAEQAVFILFCTFAILLFSRDPKFIPGWASLFPAGPQNVDSALESGLMVSVQGEKTPARRSLSQKWSPPGQKRANRKQWQGVVGQDNRKKGKVPASGAYQPGTPECPHEEGAAGLAAPSSGPGPCALLGPSLCPAPNTDTEPLLTWRKAQETVPWNVILLLGGGFAMAKGCEESGLSAWIGGQLHPLQNVPPVLAVLLVTVVIAFFTEFASNTATIVIFLPILAELAIRLRVNPLYLMIPGTVGCSYAFMLPVSTPPNSIAFASGHLLVKDMVRTGLLMNVMGVLLLSVAMNTWAQSIFQLGTFPDWAHSHSANITEPLTLTNDTFRTL
uniref:solute carrier family 13 member 3 n=1 Tax=Ictidomys tridecemlineatus TaxID=43179 RepID=UPI001A9D0E54|nr:solute carrier family 13 member 3 [Ictidomys tridecemlineatus]